MAHTLSAKKRARQSSKRRARNRDRKRVIRLEIKKFDAVVTAGDKSAAATELKKAQQVIDRIASRGAIHPNTAARRKSRLARRVNALQAASNPPSPSPPLSPALRTFHMSYDRSVMPPPSLGEGGPRRSFVSRAGLKLEAALAGFPITTRDKRCADLGANVGGFTDCLLQFGAAKVYAVDTAYGVLAWTLRKDPRVIVKDRSNALHVRIPEPLDLIAIDVGWTRQDRILPAILPLLAPSHDVISLVKPHYESDLARTQRGVLNPDQALETLWQVLDRVAASGWTIRGIVQSPLEGQKGNLEYLAWLQHNSS